MCPLKIEEMEEISHDFGVGSVVGPEDWAISCNSPWLQKGNGKSDVDRWISKSSDVASLVSKSLDVEWRKSKDW